MAEEDWDEPLQEVRPPAVPPDGDTAIPEEGDDEWGEGHLEEELRPID